MVEQVNNYVEENIYHSALWDRATERAKTKAVNNAYKTLKRVLEKYLPEEVPIELIAEQAVYIMRLDDSFLRADLGATNITLDGVSISIKDKDRTISPVVLDYLHITPDALTGGVSRRKVGRYETHFGDSHRKIHRDYIEAYHGSWRCR